MLRCGYLFKLRDYRYPRLGLGKCVRNLQTLEKYEEATNFNHAEYLKQYKKGDQLYGFNVQAVTEIPEFHSTAIRLQHIKTAADYLHIARNDMNNVFSVGFRTPPYDSSGVCHILEHLALCGSQTYPCRDPFFRMLNRSLSTFMNAFTGYDYTMYPFSTQNFHDFNNLMNVYLDATFFPLLREMDFQQEGWRLEHEDIADSTTPILIKGVVFNEMKGVFASSAYHFYENQLNKIFPTVPYQYVSGGDPLHIPNLSWQKLKAYHKNFYHPSNARFYSYGNFPLESHLTNLDKWVLSKFSKNTADTTVPLEEPWKEPREAKISCSPDPMAPNPDKQTTVSLTYLLNNITNTYESFTLAILSKLLTEGANSPFYQALIAAGVGADYSPGSGYSPHSKQGFFSIGLTGIHEDDIEKVKQTVEETFDKVIQEGFPKERIEAVLHTVELANKHQRDNFGLALIMAVNSAWNHGGDPVTSLQLNEHLDWFRQQLVKDLQYLQRMVEQYFKKNNHKLCLSMKPDDTFSKENEQKETELLEKKLGNLTAADKEKIYVDGKSLAENQRHPVDSSCLPTLLITEVKPTIETSVILTTKIENVPVFSLQEATNGIVYFRSVIDSSDLPDDLIPYLPLFCNVLTEMGAGDLDYLQQDQEISLRTGGLAASILLNNHPAIEKSFEQGILLSSHCLERNTASMFALWLDIFNRLTLSDEDRLAQLIRIETSDLLQNLPFYAHTYAIKQANSQLSPSAALLEQLAGLTYVTHQKKLAGLVDYKDILSKLNQIASRILTKAAMRCSIHSTSAHATEAHVHLGNFLQSLPGLCSSTGAIYHEKGSIYKANKSHFIMPFPVNYIAKGSPTVPYTHPDYATLRVMAKLVSSKYLHREVREVGGAYGSGVSLSQGGIWSFYSYRDPNTEQTFRAFDSSIDWLLRGDFTEQDIDEAKLGTFSEVDKPLAPGDKGLSFILNGISDQQRQEQKDRLFVVSKSQIQEKADQYLAKCEQFGSAVIGPTSDFTTNDNWRQITDHE